METNKKPQEISVIADSLGLKEEDYDLYGRYKAKIYINALNNLAGKPNGKIIFCTTINPTPAREGKTTTAIALTDALNLINKKTVLILREPSLGPVFGVRGGAVGGGLAQVLPREDIILHFTGDSHAIGSANNLISAILDNHLYHGNELNIDPRKVILRRAIDMNDRQLRFIISGLGKGHGVPREDGFEITSATEMMATFCLARDLEDLQERIGRMIIAYSYNGRPITVRDLKAQGAAAILLKEALKPNLVQTQGGSPAFIHGGPFGNIAHGCSSLVATQLSLKLSDYVVEEAALGADLGGEKFFDIKCSIGNLRPEVVVMVVSLKALKHHGGIPKKDLDFENLPALRSGMSNLIKHLENIKEVYKLPVVVAINHFPSDSEDEIELIKEECMLLNVKAVVTNGWLKGGEGALELAVEVLREIEEKGGKDFTFAYPLNKNLKDKIEAITSKIYGAQGVNYAPQALKDLEKLEESGFSKYPICIAKTQFSLSDKPNLLGRPQNFRVNVSGARVSAGAGFVVVFAGEIMTMPGLSRMPAAVYISVDNSGKIYGLLD